MKCDEAQPFCRRCAIAGRICDGYKQPSPANPALRIICPRPVSQARSLTIAESTALDFFRHTTIFQLPCASALETAWEGVAWELAPSQPSITAALVAVASAHRAATDVNDLDQAELAQQQHFKSLALLRTYINKLHAQCADDDVLVVLIACLLSFTYEAFAGEDARASIHLRAGLYVIYERCRAIETSQLPEHRRAVTVSLKPKSLFDVLVHTFIRLDSDYTLSGHDDP